MTLTMTTSQLSELITQAVDAGIRSYVASLHQSEGYLKQGEAKRYLVMRGFKAADLLKWKEAGLVRCHKGERKNAAAWYSTKELDSVMLAINVKKQSR